MSNPLRSNRIKTYLSIGFIAAGLLPWLFPSDVLNLVARWRPVLLGLYSIERFSVLLLLTLFAWLAAGVSWSLKTHEPRVVRRRLARLSVGVALGLIAAEVGGRILREPRYVEGEVKVLSSWVAGERVVDIVRRRPADRFYRIRYTDAPVTARSYPSAPPGYPTVEITLRTDQRGFRNPTGAEMCDILALGDSFTEGSRVSDQECWPAVLGRRLNSDVYNLGISGADPSQCLTGLEAFSGELKAKVAILMIYEGNDFKGVKPSERSTYKRIRDFIKGSPLVMALRKAFIKPLGPIRRNAHIPGAEILSWMPVAAPLGPEANYYAFRPKRLMRLYWTEEDFRRSYGWTSTAGVFRRVKEVCQAQGIRLVFVLAPSKPHVILPLVEGQVSPEELHTFASIDQRNLPPPREFAGQLYTLLDTQETVLGDFCREEGIEFLSVTGALRAAAREGRQVYYTYDQHWSALGHEVVAERLFRYLAEPSLRSQGEGTPVTWAYSQR